VSDEPRLDTPPFRPAPRRANAPYRAPRLDSCASLGHGASIAPAPRGVGGARKCPRGPRRSGNRTARPLLSPKVLRVAPAPPMPAFSAPACTADSSRASGKTHREQARRVARRAEAEKGGRAGGGRDATRRDATSPPLAAADGPVPLTDTRLPSIKKHHRTSTKPQEQDVAAARLHVRQGRVPRRQGHEALGTFCFLFRSTSGFLVSPLARRLTLRPTLGKKPKTARRQGRQPLRDGQAGRSHPSGPHHPDHRLPGVLQKDGFARRADG